LPSGFARAVSADGGKVGRSARCADRTPQPGVLIIFSFAYRVGRINSSK
jgi:hypothetical protein